MSRTRLRASSERTHEPPAGQLLWLLRCAVSALHKLCVNAEFRMGGVSVRPLRCVARAEIACGCI